MKYLQAVLLLLICSTVSSQTIVLFSASTFINTPSTSLSGSLRGGRTIYIQGIGFPPNPTQLQVFVGAFPCKIPADGVTQTVLSCQTGDSQSLTSISGLPIKVLYQGQVFTVPSTTYTYSDSDTPAISSVFPSASIGGTRLNYFGVHRILYQGDGVRDMGDFIGLYVGGATCSMFDISQDTINYNSVTRVRCDQTSTLQGGKYNITQQVVAGWARKTYAMRKPSLQNIYYEHTVFPQIQSLSQSTGFISGQNLEIYGTGFSNDLSKVAVSVDGVICDVSKATLTSVNCKLRPKIATDSALLSTNSTAAQTLGYISGSGFSYTRYSLSSLSSVSLTNFRSALSSNTALPVLDAGKRSIFQAPNIYGSNYGQAFKGYFYAPATGNYIFRGAADDQFILLMNQDYGTSTGTLKTIISSSLNGASADNYYISNFSSTFSQPQYLQQGKYYYMELYHVNSAGDGFLKVSVQVPNTDRTLSKQTYQLNHFQTSFVNDPQVLQFTLQGAVGGTFNLSIVRRNMATLVITYTKQYTINYNSSCADFQYALNQFDSYSGAEITCTNVAAFDATGTSVATNSGLSTKIVWTVSVAKLRTTAQLSQIFTFKGNNLLNNTNSIPVSFTQRRIKDHCPVIGGTFTMSVGGTPVYIYDSVARAYTIYNIPYSVSAATLQAALRRIVGFENVQVHRSGTPQYGSRWIISYIQYFDDVPNLEFTSLLTGGLAGTSPKLVFTETRKYSSNILFNPINQELLFTAASSPNIIVTVNGVKSVCSQDCSYTFLQTNPQITAQTKDTTGVTISVAINDPQGLNFPTSALKASVDGKPCTITSGTFASFTCTLPTNSNGSPVIRAGYYDVVVEVNNNGFVAVQTGVPKLFYDLTPVSLSQNSGGSNGGYVVQINGKGFPVDTALAEIKLCSKNALVTATTNTKTTIVVPQCIDGSSNLEYTYNQITKILNFEYTTPTVTSTLVSISPTSQSPVKKGVMTITGTGFGTNVAAITVYLSNSTGKVYQMRVLSVTSTQIKCGIPGGLAGNYDVQVSIAGVGDVPPVSETANDFKYELVINSITPNSGPYFGGTLVTISGVNFSPSNVQTLISIGNQLNWLCNIESITETSIQCRMPPTHVDWTSTTQQVIVTSKIIADSTCPSNNCQFTYAPIATSPNINLVSPATAISGRSSVTLSGFNLIPPSGSTLRVVLQNKLSREKTVVAGTSVSDTSVTFELPNVEAGQYLVRIRLDPLGETNSLEMTLQTSLDSNSLQGSVQGGNIQLKGYGLPSRWPSSLFTLTITLSNIPIPIEVISTTSSIMKIKAPQGTAGLSYAIILQNPAGQKLTATFNQTAAFTPTLVRSNTAIPIASGTQTIRINRTSLSTINPTTISIFNINNPSNLYPVSTWTYDGTFIQFDFNFKAGRYGIKLWYDGYGWASISSTIDVSAAATYTVESTQVSFAGGRITVAGTDISPDAVLKVGGYVGKVVSQGASSTVFQIPPLITPQTLGQYPNLAQEQKIIPASIISDGGSNSKSAFDGVHASFYSSTNAECFIGLDAGQNKLVNVRRIRYFPYYKWTIAANFIKGAVFQGSLDGTAYTDIATVDQTVHAGWNSIQLQLVNNYRFIRLKHTSTTSKCMISQLQINGILFNNVPVSDVTDVTTSAVFSDGFNNVDFGAVVQYVDLATPIINTISPNNGTIYGGDVLTFTGTNLDIGTPTVVIDGVSCVINTGSITATQFRCTTGERLTFPDENSILVKIGQNNTILRDQFFYVMRWSDPKTWGTDLMPVQGDVIYVPKGMTLLVDQTTPRLDGIIVQKGRLIFADEGPIQVHTNLITLNGGQFRAGTQAKPYRNELKFIMYGSYWGKQQPMLGNKGIGCLECKFSMYGTPRTKTWTQISQTISVGATTLTLSQPVDWQIGEQIVVASTDFDHNQAEQRTITAISGTLVTVDRPFLFKHFSGVQTYGANDRLPMKAQVGLLTRNIKMMGDPTSQAGQYGSHLMMAGKSENGLSSQIAYTQFTHCGQPRIVGRYCIHFHMNGDVPDSYVVGNAVHQSFARILTLHGVRYLRAANNVGYRVKGHNFFVQDGIQTHNVIQDNLVIGSLQTQNMLQTDISVASFWITNPTNHVRRNRAAGGDFYGFWYEIKTNPDGPSATQDVCPIGNPLGQSHDNIAHSYKRFGLRIFKLYSSQIPCKPIRDNTLADPWSANPSVQNRFYNYVLYKNGQAGLLAEQMGNTIFQNFTIAQSKLAGIQFYLTNFTKQLVIARDMAIIGITRTNAPTDLSLLNNARGAIGPRTSGWKMSNVRFYNFPAPLTVLQSCSKCDSTKLFTNLVNEYYVDTISFNNVTGRKLFMNGLKRDIIYDTDASFSAGFDSNIRQSATLVANFRHIADDSTACKSATTPSDWDNTLVCDQTVKVRGVTFTNLQNKNSFDNRAIKIQKISTVQQIVSTTSTAFTPLLSTLGGMEPMKSLQRSYSAPFIAGRIYNIWWHLGIDFTHLAIDISKEFLDTDPAIIFKFNYTENRELYEIGELTNLKFNNLRLPGTTALDSATCNFGDYTHDNDNRILTICSSSRGKTQKFQYLDINGIKCRYLCPDPTEQFVKQNFLRSWSNITQWPQGRLPTTNENVTIPGQWTIMMDVDPAQINFLLVDGDIIIPEARAQVNIKARAIWVRAGSIKAGNSTTAFPGKINIQLIGNKQDVGYNINEYIGGNKVFAVTGKVQLYGSTPAVVWTRAKSIVRQGATTITVTDSVAGWSVGDKLVIGPSFSKNTQHETVTITAINTSTNTITFTPSLLYTHYGATGVTVSNSVGVLDTRAAVGHLTRKIKIFSGADQGWGFQMVVNGYNENDKLRSGSVILQGVQFANGGQYDTQNTVLKLLNTVGENTIKITKSSFYNCKTYCLFADNINNAQITSNVFYNAIVNHVRAIKLNNYKFQSNLMIAVTKRPLMDGKQLISCYLTYDQIHQASVSITSNVCQGSQLHGFAFPFIPCDKLSNNYYNDNTASSATIGFIFTKVSGTCMGASGIKAYACKIAQISSSPSTQSQVFQNFMIADSERAVTLRFGKQGDDRTGYFSNSYISAISRPSCTQCYGPTAIDCVDNHGVRMLSVTVNGQTMPSKFGTGYDTICKSQVYDTKAFLQNIIFENFRQTYSQLPQCSGNVIFKPHSLAHDLTGSHHLTNVACTNCTLNAMAYFTPQDPSVLGWFGGCGSILCTGKNNYLIHDHTGHLLGSPSILLANNSQIGNKTQGCTYIPEINGHHCLREDLAVLEYESIAPDYNTRIMWPVYLKYDGGLWNTSTNGYRQWQWDGNEPLNKRLGRFISVVQLRKTYNMTFQSQPPNDMRLQIQRRTATGENDQYIIVKIYYPLPNSIRVSNRFGVVKPVTLLQNNGQNPLNTAVCGSNKFFYQNYTIHFVVTADKNCQVRVTVTNSIQLNARIDMDINAFLASGGQTLFIDRMCAVLGITDTSRVKIVSVYRGSVEITAFIDPQISTSAQNATQTNNTAQAQQMAALQQAVSQAYTSGALGSALSSAGLGPLLGMSTTIHYIQPEVTEQVKEQAIKPNVLMIVLIAAASGGGVVLVGVVVTMVVYLIRKRAPIMQANQMMEFRSTDQVKIHNKPLQENQSITNFSPTRKSKL